jgi:hypothetical protein
MAEASDRPWEALQTFVPPRRPGLDGLLCRAGARLDRLALEFVIGRRQPDPPVDSPAWRERLAAARPFYADPRFVAEPDAFFRPPAAPRVQERTLLRRRRGRVLKLTYETDFRPVFPEAGLPPPLPGTARWWRHDAPGHPVVLCVHGYAGGHPLLETLAFDAPRFYRAGMDVVLYVLPYHGTRMVPDARRSGDGFFGGDLVRTNEAFAQAIYELRALMRHVVAAGAGPVGAFGMSLGGYVTSLLATVEPDLAFAAPMIPLVSLADMIWAVGAGDPLLRRAAAHGWSRDTLAAFFQPHTPLVRPPLVPFERRLVIAGVGDRICPPGHADALWRHWGRPRIHWYPGGHLAQFRRGAALGEVLRLVRDAKLLPNGASR